MNYSTWIAPVTLLIVIFFTLKLFNDKVETQVLIVQNVKKNLNVMKHMNEENKKELIKIHRDFDTLNKTVTSQKEEENIESVTEWARQITGKKVFSQNN